MRKYVKSDATSFEEIVFWRKVFNVNTTMHNLNIYNYNEIHDHMIHIHNNATSVVIPDQ